MAADRLTLRGVPDAWDMSPLRIAWLSRLAADLDKDTTRSRLLAARASQAEGKAFAALWQELGGDG